jgi:hypothetical protein
MERATFPTLATIGKVNIFEFIQRLDTIVVFTLLMTVFFKVIFMRSLGVKTHDFYLLKITVKGRSSGKLKIERTVQIKKIVKMKIYGNPEDCIYHMS